MSKENYVTGKWRVYDKSEKVVSKSKNHLGKEMLTN